MTVPGSALPLDSSSSAKEKVEALLANPVRVSDEQRSIATTDGNFAVLACPGSGKTRTVGLRLAWTIAAREGRRVAATSYTNTAVDEIRRAAMDCGTAVGPEHYIGTLHSFLLRYVVYPFGHLEMNCTNVPRVVAEAQHASVDVDEIRLVAKKPGIPVWDYDFRTDESFAVRNLPPALGMSPDAAAKQGAPQARSIKKQLFSKGFLSFSDATYIALQVLKKHPDVVAALVRRFDEIIVDEVQDTDGMQIECLDLLKSGGLNSIVLLGDPDQAIYGWTGTTSPELAEGFASKHGLGKLYLTGNFRSSQRICDLAHSFSSRPSPDKAVGEDRDIVYEPELLLYAAGNTGAAVEHFGNRLSEYGIAASEAAVIARNDTVVRKLTGVGVVNVMPLVRVLLECKVEFSGTGMLNRTSIRRLDDLLAELAWKPLPGDSRTDEERRILRERSLMLLTTLPALSGDLASWITSAKQVTESSVKEIVVKPASLVGSRIRSKSKEKDGKVDLAKRFPKGTNAASGARTIHSVKGESHEATLLIADRPGKYDQPREWVAHRIGDARTAETNIAYVALTRARKYVAMALPNTTPAEIVGAYKEAGFSSFEL